MKANVPKGVKGSATASTPETPTIPLIPGAPEPDEIASIKVDVGTGHYEAKVFKWSDGKFGSSVGTVVPYSPNEERKVTAAKANAFATELLGQIHSLMMAQFGK
jgi:hypothetical protein